MMYMNQPVCSCCKQAGLPDYCYGLIKLLVVTGGR